MSSDSKGADQNLVDKKLSVIRQALRGEQPPVPPIETTNYRGKDDYPGDFRQAAAVAAIFN
jgi:hypothetical protein